MDKVQLLQLNVIEVECIEINNNNSDNDVAPRTLDADVALNIPVGIVDEQTQP